MRLSINRVGVSSVKRIVRLRVGSAETVFNGEFSMVADLAPDKAGVHMSRFSELLEEAHARGARARRRTGPDRRRRRPRSRARSWVRRKRCGPTCGCAPSSASSAGRRSAASAARRATRWSGSRMRTRRGVRRVVGVEAEGMTACPCAQLMVREHSVARTDRSRVQRGRGEPRARRAAGRHPQPARARQRPDRHRRRTRCRDPRRRPGRDRGKLDVERDVRSAQAPRRVLHRQQGAPQSEVRGGRRARHPGARAGRLRRFSRSTRSCSPRK